MKHGTVKALLQWLMINMEGLSRYCCFEEHRTLGLSSNNPLPMNGVPFPTNKEMGHMPRIPRVCLKQMAHVPDKEGLLSPLISSRRSSKTEGI